MYTTRMVHNSQLDHNVFICITILSGSIFAYHFPLGKTGYVSGQKLYFETFVIKITAGSCIIDSIYIYTYMSMPYVYNVLLGSYYIHLYKHIHA